MFKNLLFALMICCLFSCDYYLVNPHNNQVGVLKEYSLFGNDDFEVCFEEQIFPYYYGRNKAGYSKSKDSLTQHIHDRFDNQGYTDVSGYITVRFIINCKGQAGRFKVEEVTTDFKATSFSKTIVTHLLDIVKNINDWKAIKFYSHDYDSFYHITFKIINGELVEILP